MTDMQPGSIVKAVYKSGEYVGELLETSGPRAVVKILAVLRHPLQGDLHRPFSVDVPLFHQRMALAYTEKALVPLTDLAPYDGPVPDYRESLKAAVERDLDELSRQDDEWARRAAHQLEQLLQEYFPD